MAEENHMNQGPAVSPHTGEEQSREQTGQRSPEQRQNVQSSRRYQDDKNRPPSERVTGGEVLDDAKQRLRTLKQDTDDYVRRNPAKAVFTALGIGFVLGLMRRRH
jgi:ElaB/YqjD/DUF883 family membrane-anchored ribosome-binding protein